LASSSRDSGSEAGFPTTFAALPAGTITIAITIGDVDQSNGVIHVVDAVIVPK